MPARSSSAAAVASTSHHQDKPIPAKSAGSYIPAPQAIRILERHVAGQSIRKIAREEKRDRAAVAKVIRSEDMQAFVMQMREKFYGLADLALAAVQRGLEAGDAKLGYQILVDLGVVPKQPAPLQQIDLNVAKKTEEEDTAQHEAGVRAQIGKLIEVAMNQSRVFKHPLGEFEAALGGEKLMERKPQNKE